MLVVKATDPGGIVDDERQGRVDRNRRGLVIALRHGDRYDLALKNLACFSSENEDGGVHFAPELSVSVEKGNLTLQYSHGRYGYSEFKFRYQQGAFELIGYDVSSDHGPVVERFLSVNVPTHKAVIRTNITPDAKVGDERFREEWKALAPHAPIRLADIQDLDELNVESELGL